VFDQKIETSFIGTPYRDQFNVDDATFFGGFNPSAVASALNFRPDARFGKASGYQGARAVRLAGEADVLSRGVFDHRAARSPARSLCAAPALGAGGLFFKFLPFDQFLFKTS